ncbi:MAG: sigma-70 family RNA polymerase sigma factor [Pedobacter sp.]|nr:MAG: sigma-70 family RNA polymerase sigma factor [Pedobacter sp.]
MDGISDEDKVAFVVLLEQHKGLIHKICRLYRDHPEDRKDLFQEITFQLWKSYPAFKGNAKISTWFYRIALNTAINIFRKKQPSLQYIAEIPDSADDEPSDELARRQEQLFAAMQQLNDSDKAIMTLYLEDLTYSQIAEVIGISENYIGVKINRIKTKIQALIR